MRITKISVKKLFGVFDHEIPLNQESRITILHGPNGVGKTVLLRMIHSIFTRDYQVFGEFPFEEFYVEYDRGERLLITQDIDSRQLPLDFMHDLETRLMPRDCTVMLHYLDGAGERVRESVILSSRPEPDHSQYIVESADERRTDKDIDLYSFADLSFKEARELMDYQELIWKPNNENDMGWLHDFQRKYHTHLISADRLQSRAKPRSGLKSFARPPTTAELEDTVRAHARDLANRIRASLDEYGEIARRKERTFPRRLIQAAGGTAVDATLLESRWQRLEARSSELINLGLLETDEDTIRLDSSEFDDKNIQETMSIYVADMEEKLAVFEQISQQLRILTDIINSRFQHKTLKVHKWHGFQIEALDGLPIPLQSLSSGEQHELVLFYQLLFEAQPNSLIMIDEPEISLHVNWQEKFIDDIKRVSDLGKFDVLIATHSPDIIGDKHEWMVGLGEPEPA